MLTYQEMSGDLTTTWRKAKQLLFHLLALKSCAGFKVKVVDFTVLHVEQAAAYEFGINEKQVACYNKQTGL